jgi:hypothetical protein
MATDANWYFFLLLLAIEKGAHYPIPAHEEL